MADLEIEGQGTREADLDRKLRNALRSRHIPGESIEELVGRVRDVQDLEHLFRQVGASKELRHLLFLHPRDLFHTFDGVSVPLFYAGKVRSSGQESGEPAQSAALGHVVSMELEAAQKKRLALKNIFGLEDEQIDETIEDLVEISIWYLITFLQDNPGVIRLAQKKQVTYREMMKEIGDPTRFKEEAMQKIEETFDDQSSIEPGIQNTIEKLILRFVPGLFDALEQSSAGSAPLPDLASGLHQNHSEHLPRILQKLDVGYKGYIKLLDELYRYNAIQTRDVIHWCEPCSLDQEAYGKHYGQTAPSHLQGQACLTCERPSSYTALYTLSKDLRDLIFNQDRFLGVYVGWLISQTDANVEISHHETGREVDFLVNEKTLIECKMHRKNRDNQQVRSTLRNTLTQIEKQIEAHEDKGRDIEQAIHVWNLWQDPEHLIDPLRPRYSALFEEYDFTILGPDRLNELRERVLHD